MDKKGYNRIAGVLGRGVYVKPEPRDGEDLQFIGLSFEHPHTPPGVLNTLVAAGLMNFGSEPRLKLIGQSYDGNTQRPSHYLTFEDLAEAARRMLELPPLELETRIFFARYEEFMKEHPNEWVLIHSRDVGGFFSTQEEAIENGYRQFGNVSFLTRQIMDQQSETTSRPQ